MIEKILQRKVVKGEFEVRQIDEENFNNFMGNKMKLSWNGGGGKDPLADSLDDDGCLAGRPIIQKSSIEDIQKQQKERMKYNMEVMGGTQIKN